MFEANLVLFSGQAEFLVRQHYPPCPAFWRVLSEHFRDPGFVKFPLTVVISRWPNTLYVLSIGVNSKVNRFNQKQTELSQEQTICTVSFEGSSFRKLFRRFCLRIWVGNVCDGIKSTCKVSNLSGFWSRYSRCNGVLPAVSAFARSVFRWTWGSRPLNAASDKLMPPSSLYQDRWLVYLSTRMSIFFKRFGDLSCHVMRAATLTCSSLFSDVQKGVTIQRNSITVWQFILFTIILHLT